MSESLFTPVVPAPANARGMPPASGSARCRRLATASALPSPPPKRGTYTQRLLTSDEQRLTISRQGVWPNPLVQKGRTMRLTRRLLATGMAALLLIALFGEPARGASLIPPCVVDYKVTTWGTGLSADMALHNFTVPPGPPWYLEFDLPNNQNITQTWNGNWSVIGTGTVTVANPVWHPAIPGGTSFDLGFNATLNGPYANATNFVFNDVACEVNYVVEVIDPDQ
ncbi:cellulose binding domain-containing protein [Nonomuraea sp. NPDC049269]|uniref:cellulose binding domain-containing protein n=1 Tax=Nonomuraea sp. NPDC049269 TaxID=3364349 RepID=UPI00371F109B